MASPTTSRFARDADAAGQRSGRPSGRPSSGSAKLPPRPQRHIAAITGTRADYGVLRPVMRAIDASTSLRLSVIVTGTHLCPEYGATVEEIEADEFPIAARVPTTVAGDAGVMMAASIGLGVIGLSNALQALHPDAVMVLGHGAEAFAGATAALLVGATIVHLHGGELSGGVDASFRHAISKLAHVHFCATEASRARLIAMGESPEVVFAAGAPGLDTLLSHTPLDAEAVAREFKVTPGQYVVLHQHPVSTAPEHSARQITQTLAALRLFPDYAVIAIYPNSDPGAWAIIEALESEAKKHGKRFQAFPHIRRPAFLGLLRDAAALVGNSSTGIIEAASFGRAVVNLGSRQENRERPDNVIDAPHQAREIVAALKRALTRRFQRRCGAVVNPYGDGHAAERIVAELERVPLALLRERELPAS